MPAVFLDIVKAFDTVRHDVLFSLTLRGVGGSLLRWIRAFLSDRSMYISYGSAVSEDIRIQRGTPQGSVISPLLFLVFFDSIHKEVGSFCNIVTYADDAVVYPINPGRWSIKHLQDCLDNMSRWAAQRHISFNLAPNKTSIVFFHRSRSELDPIDFFLSGSPIPLVSSYRYLGLVVDSALSFQLHRESVLDKARKAAGTLLRLCSGSKPIFPATIATIARAVVIPTALYAANVWQPTQQRYGELRKTIATLLRKCLRLYKSVHSEGLLADFGIPMMDVIRDKLALKHGIRVANSPALLSINFQQQVRKQLSGTIHRGAGWAAREALDRLFYHIQQHMLHSPPICAAVLPSLISPLKMIRCIP